MYLVTFNKFGPLTFFVAELFVFQLAKDTRKLGRRCTDPEQNEKVLVVALKNDLTKRSFLTSQFQVDNRGLHRAPN